MTPDDARKQELNRPVPSPFDSSKVTRRLVLPQARDAHKGTGGADQSNKTTQRLVLPKAVTRPGMQSTHQHMLGAAQRLGTPPAYQDLYQAQPKPSTDAGLPGGAQSRRTGLYITVAVAALLLLMAVANQLRMQAARRRVASSPQVLPAFTQELRYLMPDAGEVLLVWGTDDWSPVPDAMRPAGTYIKDNLMHTPMVREGDVFVARIQAPANATIVYGFLITADRTGKPIARIWDGTADYRLLSVRNRTLNIEPSVSLEGQ